MPERRSSSRFTLEADSPWRVVIRFIAILIVALGFLLVGHEIYENVFCHADDCVKIHLSAMAWGIGLLSLGLLIIQKGDVSRSLQDMGQAGNFVATWWGRRAYDKAGAVKVTEEHKTVVVEAKPEDPDGGKGGQP